MAARKRMHSHIAKSRAKIKSGMLINQLHKIAIGEVEGTPTQVSAAKILLAKTVPDARDEGDVANAGFQTVQVVFGSPEAQPDGE